jgi:hypothetical protein
VAEGTVVGIVVTTAIITGITIVALGSGAAFGVRIGVPHTGRVTGAVIGDPAGATGAHPPSRTRSTAKSHGYGLNVISLQPLRHRLRRRVTMRTRSSGGTGVSVAPSTTPMSRAAQKGGSAWHRKRHLHSEVDVSLAT